MKALRMGRFFVFLLALVAGLGYWAVSAAVNAINYTRTTASVDLVEEACYLPGEKQDTAGDCARTESRANGRGVFHRYRVYVHYTSPADGQPHTGSVVTDLKTGERLSQGSRLAILASKSDSAIIKAN